MRQSLALLFVLLIAAPAAWAGGTYTGSSYGGGSGGTSAGHTRIDRSAIPAGAPTDPTQIYVVTNALTQCDVSADGTAAALITYQGGAWVPLCTSTAGSGVTTGVKDDINVAGSDTSWLLQPNVVALSEMADDAVGNAEMRDEAIDSDEYVDLSIDREHFSLGVYEPDNTFVTTDYASIQATITAACAVAPDSALVIIPQSYTSQSTITIGTACDGLTVTGYGRLTDLGINTGTTGIRIEANEVTIRDLTLTFTANNAANVGIHIEEVSTPDYVSWTNLQNVEINGHTNSGTGIIAKRTLRTQFERVHVWYFTTGILFEGEAALPNTAISIIGSTIRNNTSYGIEVEDDGLESALSITNSVIEYNGVAGGPGTGAGIICNDASGLVTIIGSHFENEGLTQVHRPNPGCGFALIGNRFGSTADSDFWKESSGGTKDLLIGNYWALGGIKNDSGEVVMNINPTANVTNLNDAGTGAVNSSVMNASAWVEYIGSGGIDFNDVNTKLHVQFDCEFAPQFDVGAICITDGLGTPPAGDLWIGDGSTNRRIGSLIDDPLWNATGDMVYSSDGSAGAILAVGAASPGDVVTLAGGVPTWAAPTGGFTPDTDPGVDHSGLAGGDGIAETAGSIAVDLNTTADGVGATSNESGMEISATGGLALIQGCANAQVLKYNTTGDLWECAADDGGGFTPNTDPGVDHASFAGGDGITETAGSIAVSLNTTSDGTGATSNESGMEIAASTGLALLQGCANTQVLAFNTTGNVWECAAAAGGGTLTGDGTATYVPYYSAAQVLTNEAAFAYTEGTDSLAVGDIQVATVTASGAVDTGDHTATSYTADPSNTANVTLETLTLSAQVSMEMTDAAGPESAMQLRVDTGTGTLTTLLNLDGVNNTVDVLAADLDLGATNSLISNGVTLAPAELARLDGLGGIIATDVTAVTDLEGDGLVIGTGTLDVDLNTTADGLGATSNESGMEISATGGLALLQGCSNAQILKYNTTGDLWECAADDGGGFTPNTDPGVDHASFAGGDGIAETAGSIAIDLNGTIDGVGATTNLSGMEITATGGLALLQGCANTEILKYNTTGDVWECAADAGGGVDVNTLTFGDGTGTLTTAITHTYDTDATDPTWTYGNDGDVIYSGQFEATGYVWGASGSFGGGTNYSTIDTNGNISGFGSAAILSPTITGTMVVPFGNNPSMTTPGQISVDDNGNPTEMDQGWLKYYDDTEQLYLFGMDASPVAANDNYVMVYDAALNKLVWEAQGATSTPGGADTQIQYNNGTVLDGTATFTYDDVNDADWTPTARTRVLLEEGDGEGQLGISNVIIGQADDTWDSLLTNDILIIQNTFDVGTNVSAIVMDSTATPLLVLQESGAGLVAYSPGSMIVGPTTANLGDADSTYCSGGTPGTFPNIACDVATPDLGVAGDGELLGDIFVGDSVYIADKPTVGADVTGFGQIWVDSDDDNLYYTDELGASVQLGAPGGAPAFTSITTGANSTATMTVAAGATLLATTTGTITATAVDATGAGDVSIGSGDVTNLSLISDAGTVDDTEWSILDGTVTSGSLDLGTGTLRGSVELVTRTTIGPVTVTAAEMHGAAMINNYAGVLVYNLPAAVAGMNACFYDYNGATVTTIDLTDATDVIHLTDTGLTAGNAIDSAGAKGDFICLLAIDATNWIALGRSGTWIDGGAS